MIVSEKNVSDALTYLALGGSADAEAALLAAERAMDRREAEVFLSAVGSLTERVSVEERKMRVRMDNEYGELRAAHDEAKVELTRAKNREKSADKMCEIWRTENANIRAAERVR